jgi:hypothetical protein
LARREETTAVVVASKPTLKSSNLGEHRMLPSIGGPMSSQERSDDPGGRGYASTKQDSNIEDAEAAEAAERDERGDTVPNNKKRKEDADGDWPDWTA